MYIIYIYISCMIDDVGITFTLINPKRGWFFSPPGWHGAELQHGCAGDRGVVIFLGSDWPFEVQPGSIQDPFRIHPYISDIGAMDSHGFREPKTGLPSPRRHWREEKEIRLASLGGRGGETRSILGSHRNLSGTTMPLLGWPIFSHLRYFMTFWYILRLFILNRVEQKNIESGNLLLWNYHLSEC